MPSIGPPPVSALSNYIQSQSQSHSSSHSPHHHNLAFQVQHNLQYQHDWTSLRVHTHSPITEKLLPRPLLSGLPPHRIYVHPDDQVEELKNGVKEGDIDLEREWVLPTQLQERWSLRRFAEVFDSIEETPPPIENNLDDATVRERNNNIEATKSSKKRRGGKRILLATLGDDSTVVYYIVHDGIVKPRQN